MRQTWKKTLYSLDSALLSFSRVTFGKPALAIVLLAILHNLLFLPLKIRAARQATLRNKQKLAELRSKTDVIYEKYQPESDPDLTLGKVTERGKELKELYKAEGVSYSSGCAAVLLPSLSGILLQSTITAIKDDERFIEGGILWFKDLTQPDRFYVLPIAFIGIAALRQYLTPVELVEIENSRPTLAKRMRTFQNWLPLAALFATLFMRKQATAAITLYQLSSSGVEFVEDLLIKRLITDAA